MTSSAFEQLERWPLISQYLDALAAVSGARVSLCRPQGPPTVIAVPLIIDGRPVAVFASNDPPLVSVYFKAVESLLAAFAQTLADSAPRYLCANEHADPPCITRAREYIRQHLDEPLTTLLVARHVHVSTGHFARCFKQTTGQTVREYVARARVERTKDLLAANHQRISEIALTVGFQSIPYFNRVFRRLTGMSPRTYQRTLRAMPDLDKRKSRHA